MIRQKQRLVALVAAALLVVSPISSFSLLRQPKNHICNGSYRPFCCASTTTTSTSSSSTALFGILDDEDDGVDFDNFNPLKYKTSPSTSNSAFGYSGTRQISLRKTRMTEMTNRLLNSAGGEDDDDDDDVTETINSILEEYRDFLLEPLEVEDAALVSIICILWLIRTNGNPVLTQ
jgi:hypothetical protein